MLRNETLWQADMRTISMVYNFTLRRESCYLVQYYMDYLLKDLSHL